MYPIFISNWLLTELKENISSRKTKFSHHKNVVMEHIDYQLKRGTKLTSPPPNTFRGGDVNLVLSGNFQPIRIELFALSKFNLY